MTEEKKKTMVYDVIDYDNYNLAKKEKKLYYIISCLCLFLLTYIFYSNWIVSSFALILSIPIKKKYCFFKIKQRRARLREQFRDLLYSLSASVTTGRQMGEAIEEAFDNLSLMYGEHEPIMIELHHMSVLIKESRAVEEILLRDFARRSGIGEIIGFADVFSTCRTTGASIEEMISRTSAILIEKLSIEKEILAITAQKKAESKIISAMPILIIVFLNLMSPGYLNPLYATILGRFIMTAALGIIILSYNVMNKISEVNV